MPVQPLTGLQALRTAAAASSLVVSLIPGFAAAQQRPNPADSQCAIYGAGFVAVQGSTTCVRIGGRVRLDLNSGSVGHAYAPLGGVAAGLGAAQTPFGGAGAAAGDGFNRAHMRLEGSGTHGRR